MQATTEQVQRLMETALVAAGAGLQDNAEDIFTGIQAVRPESELPAVGRAFGLMSAGRLPDSVLLLEQTASRHPDSELALSFLGAALKLSGRNQAAQDVLRRVAGAGTNAAAVNLAAAMAQNPV